MAYFKRVAPISVTVSHRHTVHTYTGEEGVEDEKDVYSHRNPTQHSSSSSSRLGPWSRVRGHDRRETRFRVKD